MLICPCKNEMFFLVVAPVYPWGPVVAPVYPWGPVVAPVYPWGPWHYMSLDSAIMTGSFYLSNLIFLVQWFLKRHFPLKHT
jgi:hypothetical protein